MSKVPGKIKISYLLVEIFERSLNKPKRPLIENIGILYNCGPGVRGTETERLVSPSRYHPHYSQVFVLCAIFMLRGRTCFAVILLMLVPLKIYVNKFYPFMRGRR